MNVKAPVPTEIKLHQQSQTVELIYADDARYQLSYEYLRTHSPSAEGRGGHFLIAGKQHVGIQSIEPVGHYAIKINFDDGHSSGLYTWELLYEFAINYEKYWQHYLNQLRAAGLGRSPKENAG